VSPSLNKWRQEALNEYTAAIHAVYLARGKSLFNWSWHLKAHIPCGKTRWGKVGRNALSTMASEAASEIIPHIGIASIVGQVAAATYETLPASMREKIGPPIGIGTRSRLEVSEELTLFRVDERASSEASIE
jgi:hypothetical protein